jgi:hypothetical protein
MSFELFEKFILAVVYFALKPALLTELTTRALIEAKHLDLVEATPWRLVEIS